MSKPKAERFAPLPWRAMSLNGVTWVEDSTGAEILTWKGFDGSKVPLKWHGALAQRIVDAVNRRAVP